MMVHYARREAGLVVIKLALKCGVGISRSPPVHCRGSNDNGTSDSKVDWQVHEGSTPPKWSVIHRIALGPGVKTPSGSRGTMTKRSTSPKLGLAIHHSKKLSYANKPPFKVSPVAQIRVDPASTEEEVHWWQRFTLELACFDTETLGYGVEDCWVEWWQNKGSVVSYICVAALDGLKYRKGHNLHVSSLRIKLNFDKSLFGKVKFVDGWTQFQDSYDLALCDERLKTILPYKMNIVDLGGRPSKQNVTHASLNTSYISEEMNTGHDSLDGFESDHNRPLDSSSGVKPSILEDDAFEWTVWQSTHKKNVISQRTFKGPTDVVGIRFIGWFRNASQ
ncbi:hypothetical protein ARMSODRAFT_974543 [Armillaria solidipes]|uniref:Uncharacterized protein n=1 Tax=Armillaria solidipes TaxID=1076256 RepID=A0A2H3BGP4_9AGAR|nr:hypothetical protein ARMSODRAFT_974543 [Armillaria solidipes]